MQYQDDTPPDTLRTCTACQGEGWPCSWCTGGFQNTEQFLEWARVRMSMKKLSGTYSFLESVMLDILERLRSDGTDPALALALEGHALLEKWVYANPSNGDRSAIAAQLTEFNKRALDWIQKPK